MFNRYDILYKSYRKELELAPWQEYKDKSLSNCRLEDENIIASFLLGSVLYMSPSGKIYAPWTTNQTRSDTVKDTCYFEALTDIAESYGMYINYYEDDVFVEQCVEFNEAKQFVTVEDYENALKLVLDEEN